MLASRRLVPPHDQTPSLQPLPRPPWQSSRPRRQAGPQPISSPITRGAAGQRLAELAGALPPAWASVALPPPRPSTIGARRRTTSPALDPTRHVVGDGHQQSRRVAGGHSQHHDPRLELITQRVGQGSQLGSAHRRRLAHQQSDTRRPPAPRDPRPHPRRRLSLSALTSCSSSRIAAPGSRGTRQPLGGDVGARGCSR